MQPFTTLTATAAPFYHADVDTDELIPHRYLRKPLSAGYGNFLFFDKRYLPDGAKDPDFVLNKEPFRRAQVLVSGRNFGCGSTREGAVYALADYGFRAVIAPSFSEIFAANCVQNGVLTIALPDETVQNMCAQLKRRPGAQVTIDLAEQTVLGPDSTGYRFEMTPSVKTQLLEGLDEIGLTLRHQDEIANFESAYRAKLPWLGAARN